MNYNQENNISNIESNKDPDVVLKYSEMDVHDMKEHFQQQIKSLELLNQKLCLDMDYQKKYTALTLEKSVSDNKFLFDKEIFVRDARIKQLEHANRKLMYRYQNKKKNLEEQFKRHMAAHIKIAKKMNSTLSSKRIIENKTIQQDNELNVLS